MMKIPLKLTIDASKVAEQFKEFAVEVKQDLQKAMGDLAAITHAKVLEKAQQELKSSRQTYTDNLGFEEVSPGVWVVHLDEKALWIEEGIPENFDMKPGLLKGKKYRIIPFIHSKGPSQQTPLAQSLVREIKTHMRKEKIPFSRIEQEGGKPKLGRLHQFDVGMKQMSWRKKTTSEGNPLDRVSIYQSMKNGKVRRDIVSFRTVTAGPASNGKFIHPGVQPKKYLDSAYVWAVNEWEQKILPSIMEKWGK